MFIVSFLSLYEKCHSHECRAKSCSERFETILSLFRVILKFCVSFWDICFEHANQDIEKSSF